ncbi:glycine betaine ABC transporter substrate-binding protein [Aliibacillus thermotolerans]|uniref:Glycine betaine ABC transporter substrate-binding protein n=1 Tax=Aliibacillus thermotolerans TaxID=1834418 RepID=A0ABW0U653_9BACI|nr:glycine betaine ABC transporter substrate-binding protein [Aliibacillus thermotolerans]MDA3130906.1 glycine/betaine ABC transporter [Aliibacillus thermotolerans]
MLKTTWKRIGLATGLSMSLVLAACGGGGADEEGTDDSQQDTSQTEEAGEDTAGSVGEAVDYTITGIDPGAGIMEAANQTLEDYELEGWEVQTSSDAAMTSALESAIENEEPIIVTGWNPHWKFVVHDLKYLDDPKGTFGGEEDIYTFVRLGLEEDAPEAYQVLKNFHWESSDMETVMLEISEGASPEEAARNWVDENQDLVNEWTEGVEEVDGGDITIAMVAWDSTIASTNVVKTVLEDLGYNVQANSMEAPIMYGAVAEGEADALLAGWLPLTHEQYYNEYKDQMEQLGPSLEGAKIGLVVPEYMDIDSIEDLKE